MNQGYKKCGCCSESYAHRLIKSVYRSLGIFFLLLCSPVLTAAEIVRLVPPEVIEIPVIGVQLTSPSGELLLVPANATAVALNVTAVNPTHAGFITVWPCGVARPLASNVNYVAGDIVPNGVIATVGNEGSVCFFSQRETDLIVDIAGWFEGTAYTGATPKRLNDTRDGTGGTFGPIDASNPMTIQVTGLQVDGANGELTTIPTTIGAVALNVTVVQPSRAGFVTVWPCDVARPLSSNVNYTSGQIVANGVIAPVSAAGTVCLYSLASTHVVVDLAGWLPEQSFTGITPTRLVDTRDGTGGRSDPITSLDELSIPIQGIMLEVDGQLQQLPITATAAALNVTVVNPLGAGFATVWPCGVTRPLASNMNFVAGQVVANNVVAPIGNDGTVCLYSSATTDVIVDIAGWFSSSESGAFVGTAPRRVMDTRGSRPFLDTVISDQPAEQTNKTGAIFVFAAESGSRFECSLDGGELTNCTSPHVYNGLAEGNHTFSVAVMVDGGIADWTPATYNWTIDLTPPAALSPTWSLASAGPTEVETNQTDVVAVLDHIFTDEAVQGALLLKRGYLIGERYAEGYERGDLGTSWSVAKSFYSAAIGVAIDEGWISSVDQRASDFITAWQGTVKEAITLRNLLEMRGGLPSSDIFWQADQTAYAIARNPVGEAGTTFRYSNLTAQLFEPILLAATGMSAHAYLAEKILQPIGIDLNEIGLWVDATGVNPMTYCCIDMAIDDFARFGLLYARGGEWDGTQIVSQSYVSTSLTPQSAYYGYQWWVLNEAYFGTSVSISVSAALGLDGQKIYVWPLADVVVVVLTKYQHFANQGYTLNLSESNFPNTCTGRNTCPGSVGAPVPSYDVRGLIELIARLHE
jgi:CubicO group peptidase (beta-lactamase class C family)